MRTLQPLLLLAFLLTAVAGPAQAQGRLTEPPPEPESSRLGALLLATVATAGPGVAGAIMATEEAPLTADETGVLLASGGLLFGPTVGYVALQDWRGAAQGTAIRLVGAGITAWIASSEDHEEVAIIPASVVAVVAVMDLVDLSRPDSPVSEPGVSIAPSYDPRRGTLLLSARGSF